MAMMAYSCTNATIAFLDVLATFRERAFGLHAQRYGTAVAGSGVELGILDSGGGLGASEWWWDVGWFTGCSVVPGRVSAKIWYNVTWTEGDLRIDPQGPEVDVHQCPSLEIFVKSSPL